MSEETKKKGKKRGGGQLFIGVEKQLSSSEGSGAEGRGDPPRNEF